MQERFKFRYHNNNKIYDVSAIDFTRSRGEIVSLDKMETLMCKLDLNNLIQCSGLKDKHGKRIYESDILKFRLGRSYRIGVVKCVSTIWDVSNAQIVQGAFVGGALINCHKNSEVIGNIYENPELLNDNQKRAENLITNPESEILDSIKRAKIKTDICKAIEELFDNEWLC